MAMTPVVSRHTLFYDLLDSFKQRGCPICRLGRVTVARYLDALAYENVNDPGVRDKLRSARGFCNYHAYQFLDDVRDLLAVGIVYRDVVHASALAVSEGSGRSLFWPILPSQRNGSSVSGSDDGPPSPLAPTGHCPACEALRESVSDRLHVFLQHLQESDFRLAYEASDGLCYPHFLKALAEVGDSSQLSALVASEMTLLEDSGRRYGQLDPLQLLALSFGQPGTIPHQTGHVGGVRRALRAAADAEPADWTHTDPDRCPICEATRPGLTHTLEEFALGAVSDEDPAAELASVCNRHAWQLAESHGDDLAPWLPSLEGHRRTELEAVASDLLTYDGLHGGFQLPSRSPRAQRVGRQIARRLEGRGTCPLCRAQSRLEIDALWRYLTSSQPAARAGPSGVAGNGGTKAKLTVATLCLPHLIQADCLPLTAEQRIALVERQRLGWGNLISELLDYIRKQDYRFRDEPRGHEQTSPRRAVEQMAGQKGVR